MKCITEFPGLTVITVIFVTVVAGCASYRESGIVEHEAAEIKGDTHAMIQIEDGEKSLTERGRDYQAYREVIVAPGHICIAVDVWPKIPVIPPYEYRTCPVCFDIDAAETYYIDTRWEFRWPELYAPVYVHIVEESTGQVVAEQHEFCSRFIITIYYDPKLD